MSSVCTEIRIHIHAHVKNDQKCTIPSIIIGIQCNLLNYTWNYFHSISFTYLSFRTFSSFRGVSFVIFQSFFICTRIFMHCSFFISLPVKSLDTLNLIFYHILYTSNYSSYTKRLHKIVENQIWKSFWQILHSSIKQNGVKN